MSLKPTKKKPRTRSSRRKSVLQVSATGHAHPAGLPAGAFLLFGGLCLLMLSWGIWLLVSWMGEVLFTHNDRFILQKMEARSDGLLPEVILQNWSGIQAGENLYQIDLNLVKQRLESHAIVKGAMVQRKLPNTLSLVVYERVPIARMGQVQGNMNWLLDEEGVLIKKSFESKHLPFLLGVHQDVTLGQSISEGLGGPALPYLLALRDKPSKIRDLLPVHVIHVGHPDYLDFRLSDGFQIIFPRDGNVDELLMKASRGIYEIQRQNLNITYLDMLPDGPNKIGAPE